MRFPAFVSSALALSLSCALVTSAALGKVDQSLWPAIAMDKDHFFQSRTNKGATRTGSPASDELLGYHGSDKLYGMGEADVIFGDWKPNNNSNQTDLLDGGDGDDHIYVSHGRTTVLGGAGNDRIHARYGRGKVDCGDGQDKVWQARKRRKNWQIAGNCEKVTYALEGKG